ncbi:MAG: oligoendopeptidase F [Candidatus Eisenbacteria bacterium]
MTRLRSFLVLALALTVTAVTARATERKDVPTSYTWDLTPIYKDEVAWRAAREGVERRLPRLAAFQGHLGASSDSLYAAVTYLMEVRKELEHVGTYASMLADEDTRDSHHQEMKQAADQTGVKLGSAAAFVRPEILAIGPEKVRALISEPRFKDYRPWFDDILRYAPHTLSAAEEKVAAESGRMAGTGYNVRDVFNNAEMPYPTVTLSDGKRIRVDDAAYTQYRQSVVRADRDSVFHAFWRTHQQFQGTYGATLNGQVQAHVFDMTIHHYNSCLEDAMFGDNIPPKVYHQLLSDVHANLPTLWRYLKLRKKMMGLSELRYEDLYAPIVKEVELHFTPEEAMAVTLEAVKPLGPAYADTLRKGFDSRWLDWMPSTGKASGAYSTGCYGVHPYQLMNFTGMYDEVSTLAHESGHSMHTYLSDSHQPFVTHNYATFVAEVASTLNENLLLHRMLDRTTDKNTRLFLLGSYLDNLRTTLFRQVMFAEFELAIHDKVEKGETLSGESMSKMYLDIVRRYYGHDQGVCKVDALYGVEWTYIPHFFYDFYVYQYATSIIASTAIAAEIRDEARLGKTAHRDAYMRMLESGSSKYPVDLLKEAGVDMTTSAPFQAAIREMNSVMDEMEKLLASPAAPKPDKGGGTKKG